MVERIASIRVIVVLVLAACGAWGQGDTSSVDLHKEADSTPLEVQRHEKHTWSALPDAPSATLPTQLSRFKAFVVEVHSPSVRTTGRTYTTLMRGTDSGRISPGPQLTFGSSHRKVSVERGSNTFFDRYLYPSLLRPKVRYYPSPSSSFLTRASYAASRIFIARDDSGRGRLNSSYFLGTLTSVAIHTAYRPYWRRSTTASFANFGSTIGGDTGINFFHEFAPSIRQMIKGHAGKRDLEAMGARTSDQKPGKVVSAAR